MSLHTKDSILWIVLLQARQFGMGEVNILHEFKSLHHDLQAKRGDISHSKVPRELVRALLKRKPGRNSDDREGDQDRKRNERQANPNNWNPRLRASLEGPLSQAKFPLFTKVLGY